MEENADSGGEEVQHHFSFEVARAAGDDELMGEAWFYYVAKELPYPEEVEEIT